MGQIPEKDASGGSYAEGANVTLDPKAATRQWWAGSGMADPADRLGWRHSPRDLEVVLDRLDAASQLDAALGARSLATTCHNAT